MDLSTLRLHRRLKERLSRILDACWFEDHPTEDVAVMNGKLLGAALGHAAGGAAYFLPWAYAAYHLSEKLGGDAC